MWIVFVLGIVLVGMTGFTFQQRPRSALQQLAEARTRWSLRSFANYHVVIEEQNTAVGYCMEHSDVRHEELASNVAVCATTVGALFQRIERFLQPSCDTPRCACRYETSVQVTYDQQLGYPQTMELHRSLQPNWFNPAYWQLMWSVKQLHPCDKPYTEFHTSVQVQALTPQY
jgi:hypothetical protein